MVAPCLNVGKLHTMLECVQKIYISWISFYILLQQYNWCKSIKVKDMWWGARQVFMLLVLLL